MEDLLKDIDRNEALRYLGCRSGDVSAGVAEKLETARQTILTTARPRTVYRAFDLDRADGTLLLCDTHVCLPGDSIRRFLEGCEACVLMAATLGAEVESLLRRAQAADMGRAVFLDACASAAVENVCDNLENSLRAQWLEKDGYLSGRFSPGYGDMPAEWQQEFCRLLDTGRRIGLYAGASGALIPQKSVTAVLGISQKPIGRAARGCEFCNLSETCAFRKEGKTCAR